MSEGRLVPVIHDFLRETWMASDLGLARGPHQLALSQVGQARLAMTSTAMTQGGWFKLIDPHKILGQRDTKLLPHISGS